jgi:hypothetical protein
MPPGRGPQQAVDQPGDRVAPMNPHLPIIVGWRTVQEDLLYRDWSCGTVSAAGLIRPPTLHRYSRTLYY